LTIEETNWAWHQSLPPVQKLMLVAYSNRGVTVERAAEHCGISLREAEQITGHLFAVGLLKDEYGRIVVGMPEVESTHPPPYRKAEIPAALRTQVFERDGYRCRHCGTDEDLQADHIHPEVLGGPTELANLQTLCGPCNLRKGAKP
jgi:hypothetical protein